MDPQMALVLLRECYLPVATHLVRMVAPTHTVPHAQLLDTEVHATYRDITGDERLSSKDPEYFQSFKHGGKGFRSVASTAPIAHYASSVQSVSTLARLVPVVGTSLSGFLQRLASQGAPPVDLASPPAPIIPVAEEGAGRAVEMVGEAWEAVFRSADELRGEDVDLLLPQTEEQLFEELSTGGIHTDKLQNALTLMVEKVKAKVLESQQSQFDGTRTESTSSSGSSSVFTCIPTDECLVLPPGVLRFVAQYTAGTHAIPNPRNRSCVCDGKLSTVHVLSCKKMRGIFVRHDLLRDVLKKICALAGVVANVEVMVVEGRQKRMDLVLYFSNPVRRVWVDVSVVNPQAEAYVGRNGIVARENAKLARWRAAASDAGVEFLPFVVDTFEKSCGVGVLLASLPGGDVT